ncbi:MAG: tyrosine-type recombinase/integrase [Candidatus Sumerlaeaceae bacterium]|nr:tyrosine-type recombinase/integrase [Candidatus Sumerlaeaceae bacterium]
MSLLFSAVMQEFDRFLEVERNLSPATRAAYQYDLQKFKEFLIRICGSEPTVGKVTTLQIKDYLGHLQSVRKYKSATLARAIASIRVFFEYCVSQSHIPASPATHIHNPKLPKKLPIYLIESELKKLLSAPQSGDVWGARDFAILVLLGFTGMRRQELVGLNLDAVDFERKTVRVFGKGSKERLIPMNPFVVNAMTAYLEVRPATGDSSSVFLNRSGKRLTGRSVFNIVRKYVRRAGITKTKISPHKLRHTFATLLHLNEVDIIEIQRLLGHASVTSTQIYTHTNTSKLRSAVDRISNIAVGES